MTVIESLHQLLLRVRSYSPWEVAAELIVIWIAVFAVWRFVEGARGAAALKGILFLVLVTLGLRLVLPADSLQRLAYLYDKFLAFAALALVIIFQPELRRAMIRLGETPFFRTAPADVPKVVDALVTAAAFLSKNKFGAIIAIERQVGLREIVEGSGRTLNADVSPELLQSIFWPNNPLHDMGVVIKDAKIVAAGVQFPLADPEDVSDTHIGTRHRAAVGLSRVADAVVLIVSEETGAISIAERGRLNRWLSPEALRVELMKLLTTAPTQDAQAALDENGARLPELPKSVRMKPASPDKAGGGAAS